MISEKEKKITAYHEGGHALAAWAMPGLEPVYKVTILPRGRTGGHALVVPEDDKSLMTRSEMIARLVMAMGGRAAEELVFAEPTTGASSDIAQATKIARAMVTEYGMSAKLGAVKYGHGDDEPFLGRTYGSGPEYSIEVGSEIDGEVRALIEAAHTEAWAVLNTYRDILDSLAAALLEKETLERRDLEVIFAEVEKRPRITTFDQFGVRGAVRPAADQDAAASWRIERGEPWPPEPDMTVPAEQPVPIGASARPAGQSGYTQQGPDQARPADRRQGVPDAPPAAAAAPGRCPAGPPAALPPNWTGGVLPGPLGADARLGPARHAAARSRGRRAPASNGQATRRPRHGRTAVQPGGGNGAHGRRPDAPGTSRRPGRTARPAGRPAGSDRAGRPMGAAARGRPADDRSCPPRDGRGRRRRNGDGALDRDVPDFDLPGPRRRSASC